MNKSKPYLALVVPCYNEEATLLHTVGVLDNLLADLKTRAIIAEKSFVFYVDDGSQDKTWQLIEEHCGKTEACRGLKLAGNVGHQNALMGGMLEVDKNVDCLISLDADLQDDIAVIERMIERFKEGHDIVYGAHSTRKTDYCLKRNTAALFYKIMQVLNVKMIPHHADFRLISRNVLTVLPQFTENTLFLRGLFPSMGFKNTIEHYERQERQFGFSKYPFRKMLALAWQGLTSFSAFPLRLVGMFSLFTFLMAIVQSIIVFYDWVNGNTVAGWTSTMIIILYLGAAQLFSIAVIGEYLAKIFIETKKRPRYIVEKQL